jgi:tetratricopeptide (TPR) repeat protein
VRATILDLPPAAHLGSALAADPLGPLRSLAYALQVSVLPFGELVYEPPFESWFAPPRTALAALVALGLAAGAARPWPAARPRLLFWLGWFGLWWFPTANLLPQEVRFADRFVFVASLAIFACGAGTLSALPPASFSRRIATALACTALLAAAVTSLRLGAFYRDEPTFYRQWVRTSPRAANVHFSLGTALAREGREIEALAELREAVRLGPQHGGARFNLAALLARQGRLAEAETLFRDVLRIDPRDADAHQALAVLLERSGQTGAARAHYAEALRLRPDLEEAARGLARQPPAPVR